MPGVTLSIKVSFATVRSLLPALASQKGASLVKNIATATFGAN